MLPGVLVEEIQETQLQTEHQHGILEVVLETQEK